MASVKSIRFDGDENSADNQNTTIMDNIHIEYTGNPALPCAQVMYVQSDLVTDATLNSGSLDAFPYNTQDGVHYITDLYYSIHIDNLTLGYQHAYMQFVVDDTDVPRLGSTSADYTITINGVRYYGSDASLWIDIGSNNTTGSGDLDIAIHADWPAAYQPGGYSAVHIGSIYFKTQSSLACVSNLLTDGGMEQWPTSTHWNIINNNLRWGRINRQYDMISAALNGTDTVLRHRVPKLGLIVGNLNLADRFTNNSQSI